MSQNLDFTGERFTPECIREIRYEHFHRYALAASWVSGLNVLDAACGEGYGSHLLSAKASSVTGVDISAETISHARSRYEAANLRFVQADCCATSLPDESFDCVISFETLEHLESQKELLTEFRRLLKPSGFLIISSPDKAVYTDKLGNENPYHVSELYRPEFEQLLAQFFPCVKLMGQKLAFHSMIWPLQENKDQQYELQQESNSKINHLQKPTTEPVYLLAICSNDKAHMPALDKGLFLFDDEPESVYAHYYHEIRRNLETGRILQELETRVAELQAALESARKDATVALKPQAAKSWFQRVLQKLTG